MEGATAEDALCAGEGETSARERVRLQQNSRHLTNCKLAACCLLLAACCLLLAACCLRWLQKKSWSTCHVNLLITFLQNLIPASTKNRKKNCAYHAIDDFSNEIDHHPNHAAATASSTKN
jgi:hypothetical protein